MLKKLFIFFIVALMGLQPLTSSAADLNAAFSNLLGSGAAVGVNQPGRYQSGTRNSFVAGGLDMRVPRSQNMPQLFSVTPPKITAGCNGISAHFGGFSFISGAEFQKALKAIASGAALGFVSMMVMKVLCPPCEAVVQFLKTAAQQAARLAKDSCQWGQDLAKSFMSGESTESRAMPVCGTTISGSDTTKDFLSAVNDGCDSLKSAIDSLLGENPAAKGSDPDSKANKSQLLCELGAGNITWSRLKAFDRAGTDGDTSQAAADSYASKLLLMNMMGVELGPTGTVDPAMTDIVTDSDGVASCETADGGSIKFIPGRTKNYCSPPLDASSSVGLFLCGAPTATGTPFGTASENVKSYCATYFERNAAGTAKDGRVFTCGADKELCTHVKLESSSNITSGEGFLIQVNKLLLEGVDAVRQNKPMPVKVLQLMQAAPYPLYQAINAAAVYPTAASDLVDAMSILVAEQLAVAHLDEALRIPGKSTGAKGCLSSQQASKIMDIVGSMRIANKERLKQIAQNITAQEVLSEQIRQVNLAIQKQVMSGDMLNQGKFTQSMSRVLAPNVSKSETTASTPATAP